MALFFSCNGDEEKLHQVFTRLKHEYNGKAFNNHKKLALLNLNMESLPKDLLEDTELCATFCQLLGLDDINRHSLTSKFTEMLLNEHHIHEHRHEIKLNKIQVKKLLKDVEKETQIIKRAFVKSLDEVEEMTKENEKKAAAVAYLEKKLVADNEQLGKYEETLLKIKPSFEIKEIFDNDGQIKSMDAKIKDLQSKLDTYRNLPPDITLAKEKLNGEKMKLEKSQEALATFFESCAQAL